MSETKVVFQSDSRVKGGPNLSATVHRDDSDEPLLTLDVRELNISREGAPEAVMVDAQASLVSVVALTWAT